MEGQGGESVFVDRLSRRFMECGPGEEQEMHLMSYGALLASPSSPSAPLSGVEPRDRDRKRQQEEEDEAARLALQQTINQRPQRPLPLSAPHVLPADTFHTVVHKLAPEDTLSGLAIAYDVTEMQILEANSMLGQPRAMHACKFLRIPLQSGNDASPRVASRQLSMEEEQARDVSVFCVQAGCDALEARFYLSENHWDFLPALMEYRADKELEQETEGAGKHQRSAECTLL